MIFVTVGTHHQPFQRLLDGLAGLDLDQLVIQHGPGAPPPGAGRTVAYMPFDEMLDCLREAEKVITHAGVGSILCATREGHRPLVVPRRRDLGEHVDDHQVELTRALEGRGRVVGVWDVDALAGQLAEAGPRGSGVAPARDPALSDAVGAALAGESQASDA